MKNTSSADKIFLGDYKQPWTCGYKSTKQCMEEYVAKGAVLPINSNATSASSVKDKKTVTFSDTLLITSLPQGKK